MALQIVNGGVPVNLCFNTSNSLDYSIRVISLFEYSYYWHHYCHVQDVFTWNLGSLGVCMVIKAGSVIGACAAWVSESPWKLVCKKNQNRCLHACLVLAGFVSQLNCEYIKV